jgi:hypothetical protein
VCQFLPHLKKQLPESCAVIDDAPLQHSGKRLLAGNVAVTREQG